MCPLAVGGWFGQSGEVQGALEAIVQVFLSVLRSGALSWIALEQTWDFGRKYAQSPAVCIEFGADLDDLLGLVDSLAKRASAGSNGSGCLSVF